MNRPLQGHSILIVEDEPLIAFDMTHDFAAAGARVLNARTLDQALLLMEVRTVSAAIVDFGLGQNDSTALCQLLRRRCIPFIHHSGYTPVREVHAGETVVGKPANNGELVSTVAELLRAAPQ